MSSVGRTAVKICGISTPEAYEAARPADYVGFVFFPPSPRAVTPQRAAALATRPGPLAVGLFVDPTDALVAEVLGAVALDALQVVASPARAAELRARFGRDVWRAVGVRGAADLPDGMDGADALLLDAEAPQGATRPGGNAVAFDWGVLPGRRPGRGCWPAVLPLAPWPQPSRKPLRRPLTSAPAWKAHPAARIRH